jgi:tRNA(Arg) A34 adenosine deaminase TadA
MNSTPENYMREALRAAERGLEAGEMPIGAATILGDRTLSLRHRRSDHGQRLGHAEFLALADADEMVPFPGDRSDVILVTTLEPCVFCFGAATAFGVREIYYGLEAPLDGAVSDLRLGGPQVTTAPEYRSFPIVTGGVLRSEALDLFHRYVEVHGPSAKRWARALIESVTR